MPNNDCVIIVDLDDMFREGLRRILATDFHVVWCGGALPDVLTINTNPCEAPLVLIGGAAGEAIIHVAEVQRFDPNARIMVVMKQAWQQQDTIEFYRRGVLAV